MPERDELILKPADCEGGCEPDPNPWAPERKTKVKIINQSGADQRLTNIRRGLLKGKGLARKEVTIPDGETWKGRVGKVRGSYSYKGCPESGKKKKKRNVRNGTIDPS